MSCSLSDDGRARGRDPDTIEDIVTRAVTPVVDFVPIEKPSLNDSRPSEPPCLGHDALRVSFDDLTRVSPRRLARLLLDRAAEDPTLLHRLRETVARRPARSTVSSTSCLVVGDSPTMRQAMALIHRFEQTDEPVLITGESGTGKELLARAIHDGSRRASGPFVALNCAAIPAGLVASELFGYEKGAFTGASARTLGQIEHANGGTLFLDEIGDMPIDLQGHLLRFLQDGQIRRLGGRDLIPLDVRIVSATNVRLGEAIAEGRFREDLFYRLNVLTLSVPPLRDRPADIPLLAMHFLDQARRDFGRPVEDFSEQAMAALMRHRWPGNVRELISVIRRAVVVGDGPVIGLGDLMGVNSAQQLSVSMPETPRAGSPREREVLLAALDRSNENISSAADSLRVSRVTLYRMLRRHGIALKRGLAEAPIARRAHHVTG